MSCRRARASAARWPSSAVKEGDEVKQGQVVAIVGDEKLVLQMKSLDAQIAGLEAQLAQAQTDLKRAEDLFSKGTIPRTRLDEARTAFNVATNAHRAKVAERSVIEQQLSEGKVLAPTAGRVLKVPVTAGTVILPGEAVATIAEKNFVLRLRVPERHALYLKAGDTVRIDGERARRRAAPSSAPSSWSIRRSRTAASSPTPRSPASATISSASASASGCRPASARASSCRPSFIITRFGIDYARVRKDGARDRRAGAARPRHAAARHARRA